MQITLNGEVQEYMSGTTVQAMLDALELGEEKVAVERNLEIVPRSVFAVTPLADGDVIEIVAFIGGG